MKCLSKKGPKSFEVDESENRKFPLEKRRKGMIKANVSKRQRSKIHESFE